jgi:hypothetical protein
VDERYEERSAETVPPEQGETNEADGQVGKKPERVDLMVEDLFLALHVNLQRGERWLLFLPAWCA